MLRQAMSSELTATVIRRHAGPITTHTSPSNVVSTTKTEEHQHAPALRDLRSPLHLPESSCDLFPIGHPIIVPANES